MNELAMVDLMTEESLSDQQLLRWSRQIMLQEMDIAGQEQLAGSEVAIVGAGGLGCPVALYLAAAGVGRLTLIDDDRVSLSNLQRQIAFAEADIGQPKVRALRSRLQQLNSQLRVTSVEQRLSADNARLLLANMHLVLDCSDNFATRFLINQFCYEQRIPLISAAAIGFSGQLARFDFRHSGSACYRCLFPEQGEESQSCAENGILGPIVGTMGCLQAAEAIKLLAAVDSRENAEKGGYLLILEGLSLTWRKLSLTADPQCPICGSAAE